MGQAQTAHQAGGVYMGGKNVVMEPAVDTFVERNFIGLRENSVGLLELSFVLRDKWMNRVAVMDNNMFVAKPDRMFDLSVNAGATTINIREGQRRVLLDLATSRKSPEALFRLLEADWEHAQKFLQREASSDDAIGPVFRDYLLGPLTAVETGEPETPSSRWLDESSGEVIESRQHLFSFILDWASEYCIDDEGLIPVLDFRNMLTYIYGRKLEIRNGVKDEKNRSMAFGAYFSSDSPHPSENPDDPRPRKALHFPP
jgi:hypothetical protein